MRYCIHYREFRDTGEHLKISHKLRRGLWRRRWFAGQMRYVLRTSHLREIEGLWRYVRRNLVE